MPFGSRALTIAQVQDLPTDPRRLADVIREAAVRNSRPLAYQELDLVGELLRNAPVDPELGAALYGALSTMPGIEALGTRTDQLGRTGQAVGTVDGTGARLELVIDPRTGRLLADRTVAVEDLHAEGLPFTPGDVMEEFTYVAQGVVDSTGQRVR